MGNLIRLALYHEKYDEELANFTLKGEQVRYTALPAEVIEEAIQNSDKDPIIIFQEEKPVGFFILHQNSEYIEQEDSSRVILVRALSISLEYQGKGYAKAAMKALPELVSQLHPHIKEIRLAVNEGNTAAQQLYLKVGFLDRGVRKMGSKGLQVILHHSME